MTGELSGISNWVPRRYRGVAVASLPHSVPLTAEDLRRYFLGRDAYRRTRFVVVRGGCGTALLRVERAAVEPLFAPITVVELIAGPDECRYVIEPEVDTGIPSELARVALTRAPQARAVAVQGRYAHVNVIVAAQPLRVAVREIVPPEPAKLLDQAQRVLAMTEDLPPIELVGELTALAALAARRPAPHYLLPCRGSGGEIPGARVSYLDDHPPRADWTLIGCARSRQIHRHFYGDDPPTVDLCPRPDGPLRVSPLLTKCCLQEEHVSSGPGWACVPWGSSLEHVREGLAALAAQQEPVWAPA